MRARELRVALVLILAFVGIDAEAAQTLDICGELYRIYEDVSKSGYSEEQQKEYFQANLEGKRFQVTGVIKDIINIKTGIRLHMGQDKCVSVVADCMFLGQCEIDYLNLLKQGDHVTVEGDFFYYSTSSSTVAKLNDAKVLSSTCDKPINTVQRLETALQNSQSIESSIHSGSKKDCPEDLLSAGSAKGKYLGTICVDYCYSTIKLASGKEISVMCEDDEADVFFGKGTGQEVEIDYDVVQFWNQYSEQCQLTTVCKSGKALSSPAERTK